jgi:hypothetical protein
MRILETQPRAQSLGFFVESGAFSFGLCHKRPLQNRDGCGSRSLELLPNGRTMRGILFTVVDIFGVFIPGALILVGVLGFPPLTAELRGSYGSWLAYVGGPRATAVLVAAAVLAYTLGFLGRLASVSVLQRITIGRWREKLRNQVATLETVLERYLNDQQLSEALRSLSKLLNRSNPGSVAPHFHFAKRVIRGGPAPLWAEAERLEAEVRFTAGLFAPLCLLTVDASVALYRCHCTIAIASFVVCCAGLFLIFDSFPDRRIREVMYDYYLALAVLRSERGTQGSHKRDAVIDADGPE